MDKYQNCIRMWDFAAAERIITSLAKVNFYEYFPSLCQFLTDCGKVEELLATIDNNMDLVNQLALSNEKFATIISHYNNTKIMGERSDFFGECFRCAMNDEVVELCSVLNYLKKVHNIIDWDNLPLPLLDYQELVIVCFALNKIIISNIDLDPFVSFSLLKLIRVSIIKGKIPKSTTLVKFITKTLIDYYSNCEYEKGKVFYSIVLIGDKNVHLSNLFNFLLEYDDEVGAETYNTKLNCLVKYYNPDLSIPRKNPPRVAIIVSGMFRGNKESLHSIFDKLASPLNADVFCHTWDRQQVYGAGSNSWLGFGGAFKRVFGYYGAIPENIRNENFVRLNFPRIHKELFSPLFSSLTISDFSEFPFKMIAVENEEKDFMRKYCIDDNFCRFIPGNFNQIKQFYGIYRCFTLMQEYACKRNVKYDIIIRVRIDSLIKSCYELGQIQTIFQDIKQNALYTISGGLGLDDAFFYGSYSTMKKYAMMFILQHREKAVHIFQKYIKQEAHRLMLNYSIYNDIFVKRHPIEIALAPPANKKSFKQCLDIDLSPEMKSKFPEECDFLYNLLSKYG